MERLDHFMARANALYYASHDPFADFTTAPEITQAFGELLGAWAAITWASMGRPNPVILAEAGPGRGTLMADALRGVARVAPDFRAALRVHLVETSPRLRALQAASVPGAVFHDSLGGIPDGPIILLANEFLDALPIRQFVRRGNGWFERYVANGTWHEAPSRPARGQGEGIGNPGDRRTQGDSPSLEPPSPCPAMKMSPQPDLLLPLPPAGEGRGEGGRVVPAGKSWRTGTGAEDSVSEEESVPPLVFETRHPTLAATLGARLRAQGGAALFLDYGPAQSAPGDSLQALRDGQPADPLTAPGTADLTAHVDFAAFGRDSGAAVHGPIPQGQFLTRLGLFQRIDRLAATQPWRKAAAMTQAGRRLAEPERMGALFKAMALTHPDLPPPPGFEA